MYCNTEKKAISNTNLQVIDAMFEHKVKAGETVIRQGDDGDYFYVVEEGVYHALINCDDGSMKKVTNIENVKLISYPTQVTLP